MTVSGVSGFWGLSCDKSRCVQASPNIKISKKVREKFFLVRITYIDYLLLSDVF